MSKHIYFQGRQINRLRFIKPPWKRCGRRPWSILMKPGCWLQTIQVNVPLCCNQFSELKWDPLQHCDDQYIFLVCNRLIFRSINQSWCPQPCLVLGCLVVLVGGHQRIVGGIAWSIYLPCIVLLGILWKSEWNQHGCGNMTTSCVTAHVGFVTAKTSGKYELNLLAATPLIFNNFASMGEWYKCYCFVKLLR